MTWGDFGPGKLKKLLAKNANNIILRIRAGIPSKTI
jgi:hypothetical protein